MCAADPVSALRAKKRFPFYTRTYLVPRTYIRSTAVTQVAEFLITTLISTTRCALSPSHSMQWCHSALESLLSKTCLSEEDTAVQG